MPHGHVKLSDRDPSSLFGSIGAVVGAVIALLVAFGVVLTEDQTAAILGLVAVLSPIVTAYAIRRKAYSPATHFREVEEAALKPPPVI